MKKNSYGFHLLMCLAIATGLETPAYAQADPFVFISSYRTYFGNNSPLRIYSRSGHQVNQTSAFTTTMAPHHEGPFPVTTGEGSMVGIINANGTFLVMATFDGGLNVMQLAANGPDLVHQQGTAGDAYMLIPSPDRTKLYMGVRVPSSTIPYAFQEIYEVDVSNLPSISVKPTPVAQLTSSSGSPAECFNAAMHPNGTRIIVACYGGELFNVDLATSTVTATTIPYANNGNLAIEPTSGNFAYFGSVNPSDPILVLDLSGGSISVSGQISQPRKYAIFFHSSGKWAYVLPGSSDTTIYKLDTTYSGSACPCPASGFSTATTMSGNMIHNSVAVGSDRLYSIGVQNGQYFLAFDIDLTTGGLTEVTPRIGDGSAGGNFEDAWSLAIPREAMSRITAKAIPSTAALEVSLSNLLPANTRTIFVPGGSTVPIDALSTYQPTNYSTTTERYEFQGWTKNTPCGSPTVSNTLQWITDPVPGGLEDTYCACFDKQWYLSVTVNGSCTATPSGWVKEGDSVNFTATGTNVSVAVSGDATSVSQSIVMNSAKSVTVTCTTSTGTGGACSPLSASPDLVGWYKFEEPSSQGAFADSASAPVALNQVTTVQRGTGKVGNAVYFDTTPFGASLLPPSSGGGGSAASNTSAAKYNFGTGAFSIDFWIQLDGSLPNGRPILQKMSGLADNQVAFPPGANPAFGYRVRTVAGDLLQLTLASNSTFANYVDTVALPVGTWTQVTIVVPRTSPPVFYVNGTARTPNGPPTFNGTLDNTAPLLVGNIAGPGSVVATQPGSTIATRFWLDELEFFKTALSAADVATLVTADKTGKCPPAGPCTARPAGLVGWWGFEPSTATSIADLSNNGNTGSISGGRIASSNMVGDSFGINTSNAMAVASSNSLNFGTGPFSMDVWVKWPNNSSPGPNPTLVNKFDGTRGYRFEIAPDLFGTTWAAGMTLLLHDTTGTFQWFTGVGGAFAKNVIPSDGGWHLIGFSYQPAAGGTAAVVKFFVDGKVVSTGMNGLAQGTVVPNVSSTASLQVGSHWSNISSLKFRGEIDELEIFNQVVAEADMKRIYDAGPSGKCRDDCATPPANMGAWYRFEEAAGSLFLDSAGSTNDMAQVGMNGILRNAGQVGQSVRFNDDRQHLSVAAGPETGFISSGSIDLWINTIGNPLVPIVDRSDSVSGYRFYVQNGNPVLQLSAGGSTVTWTSSLTVPVNAWTFLAVTFDRTSLSNKPVFYVNSTLDNNPNGTGLMLPLPIVPNAPLWIGGMRPVPSQRIVIEASFDELEIIQRALSVAELQAIFTAGAKGKCVPPNAPAGLILDTNPVGLNLNYNSFTNQAAAIFLPNVTGNTTASAPTPQVSNGGYYVFQNWTETDPAATPAAGPVQATIPAPPTGQTYTWTANYNLAGYLARAVGCGATIGPLSAAISNNPLVFPVGTSITVTANPPFGQQFQNFQITNNGVVTTSTTNPAQITVDGQISITANCAAGADVPILVNTNPPNIGATVGVQGVGAALNQYASSVTPGNVTVTVTPASITSGNVKYDFRNSWSFNGTPNATWTQAAQVVSVPSTGGTYTANFDTSYLLDVVVNGNCRVNPQTGFYPSGSSQTVNVTLPLGSALGGITYTTGRGAVAPVNNGGTITINGPGTLTVNCGQNPSVLINTNPTPIGVTVGLQGIGTGVNSYSNASVAPGAAQLTATPAGPFLAADNHEYAFKEWRQGSLVIPASVTIPSSGAVTYTAFYSITGFKITVVNNGCQTTTVNPSIPASGIVPVGYSITSMNATPSGSGQWTNVVVDLSAQNNSGTLTLLPGQAASSTIPLAGPTTITFNCAGSIVLTGHTNPTALQITVAGNNGPAPRAQVVTAGVAQPVSAATPQIANGTGYEFTAWTGPVANVSNASTTVTATTNTTVTANFRVLCYVLTVNVSPSNGGTVTRNPASGVTTGVLSNCYAPGTTVTLTGNAGTGFGAPSWSGATPGSGSTATVVMDQPRTVNVTFNQVANPNANDPVFLVASRAGGNLSMDLSNRGSAVIQNLRITAVTAISNGFTLNMQLPRNFAGALNPGANTGFNMFFQAAAGTNPDAAFVFTLTAMADNLASFTRTVTVAATPTAVLAPSAVSRTNSPGVAALVFKIDNSGTGPATSVSVMASVQSTTAGLTLASSSASLGTVAAGGSANLPLNVQGTPGSNLSAVDFNITLTITFIAPNLTQTQVVRSFRSMGNGTFVPI